MWVDVADAKVGVASGRVTVLHEGAPEGSFDVALSDDFNLIRTSSLYEAARLRLDVEGSAIARP
jgi:hypothetical protein